MTYTWTTSFNLGDALNGTLVGFPVTDKPYDLSNTGTLVGPGPVYTVKFGGYTLKVLEDGTVNKVTPANDSWLNQTLQMVTAVMGDDGAVGGTVRRAAGETEGHDANVTLTVMEPRDHFAIQVLSAMLVHADHPETFDDATCLSYSTAAYRWAQAMMQAAANSRYGQSTQEQPSEVDVNPSDLQDNKEKLLYNMSLHLKGLADTGLKITEMPDVTIDEMPNVVISGTPSVNVANQPTVSVSNMPSEPIEIEGTVSVNNFPQDNT